LRLLGHVAQALMRSYTIRLSAMLICPKPKKYILETIQSGLPCSIELNPDLYTAENHFFTPLEINSQLHNISILDWKWFTFRARRTQSHMI
jgi:hypothetical protein